VVEQLERPEVVHLHLAPGLIDEGYIGDPSFKRYGGLAEDQGLADAVFALTAENPGAIPAERLDDIEEFIDCKQKKERQAKKDRRAAALPGERAGRDTRRDALHPPSSGAPFKVTFPLTASRSLCGRQPKERIAY